MRRLTSSILALLFSLCSLSLWAGTTIQTEIVRKAIVFIYAANATGTDADSANPMGTGFLVFMHVKGDAHKGALMLITARHIVDPDWLYCPIPQPEVIFIRLNNKDYDPKNDSTGVAYLKVVLVDHGNKKYFVRNDDDEVDAAMVPLQTEEYKSTLYDFAPLALSTFGSPEEVKQMKIGDSIASAGLLPKGSGEKRNYPFFKFGEISNIPDESIKIACAPGLPERRLERVWFVAANLIQGNSGSPIFYTPPEICGVLGLNCAAVKRAFVLGVQSSAFGGADIAGMTPIEDVFKIIEKHAPPEEDLFRGDETTRKPDEPAAKP